MTLRTITALFDTLADADRARDRLIDAGIARDRISVIAQGQGAAATAPAAPQRQGGFFADLANLFLPDEDRYTYEEGIRRGGQLLTVRTDEADVDRVVAIIETCGPVDIDRRVEEWRNAGWQGIGAAAAPRTGQEEVIPIVEEQLRVGKREVARGGVRVHSHIVEKPVEEQVNLRDERVTLERRPVNRPVAGDPARLLQEREIEMTETGEEAVVSKEAVVREELVLRKDAAQHTETVRDTVRRTEVDIDRDADRAPRGPRPGRDAAE